MAAQNKRYQTAIVWFRRDLRLHDNPALTAACEQAEKILPVFLWAPGEEAPWQPGAASRWWLHHALAALQQDLRQRKAELLLEATVDSLSSLQKIIKKTGAEAVFWNRLYEPAIRQRDEAIKSTLSDDGIKATSCNGALLIEPWDIQTKQDNPYRVFTPFWREAKQRISWDEPLTIPSISLLDLAEHKLTNTQLEALKLLPTLDWDAAFYDHWTPGPQGAADELEKFVVHRIHDYSDARNHPATTGTSRLSPHLHFGSVSPREIAYRIGRFADRSTTAGIDSECDKYLSEIGWREFAHHLLYHYPQTTSEPLNEKFKDFPWQHDSNKLKAWQQGKTGIPIVDAGMRELWQTGWMHNRVRMLVGSLLVKNLHIHWHEGAEWFWDTLVDASLANNTLGWQWIAGCGADAAPFFRIFNPVTQAEKFDPQQRYIKTYVPEVNRSSYPEPIVDLKVSRKAALEAYQKIK